MLTPVEPLQVTIDVVSVDPESVPGRWRVTWLIRNGASAPLALEEAWIPHGRFRGDGHVALDAVLSPGASTRLSFSVAAEEPPRTVVENAFLILRTTLTRPEATLTGGTPAGPEATLTGGTPVASRTSGSERAWRLFVRMTIAFDDQARPQPIIGSVTAQSLQ